MQSFFRCFLILFIGVAAGYAAPALGGEPEHAAVEAGQHTASETALLPVRFYRKHLSPVLGGRCPMSPSCSQYAADAVEKHGALLGWFMACDRLMRCGRDEVMHAPVVHVNHVPLSYDPVEENDFWLE